MSLDVEKTSSSSSPGKNSVEGVSLEKKKELAPAIMVVPARKDQLSPRQLGLLSTIYREENLITSEFLAHQTFVPFTKGHEYVSKLAAKKKFHFSAATVGHFLGIPHQQATKLHQAWLKLLSREKKTRGRSKLLSDEHIEKINQYVAKCDDEKLPLTQSVLQQWIFDELEIPLSLQGLKHLIASNPKLHLVSANPLERACAEVSVEQLCENVHQLVEKLKAVDPHLVFNMDESALDSKHEESLIKVVSCSSCPCNYISDRGEGHITFVPTISLGGFALRLMMIVKTQSIASELAAKYGLPDNHWGYVTSSSSAYMNTDLFKVYLKQILVPGIKEHRQLLGLPPNAKALLILDSCLCHSKEELEKLKAEHNIDYHYLVPHSSHLTQALDCGVLGVFK